MSLHRRFDYLETQNSAASVSACKRHPTRMLLNMTSATEFKLVPIAYGKGADRCLNCMHSQVPKSFAILDRQRTTYADVA